MSKNQFEVWFKKQKKKVFFSVKKKDLSKIKKWNITNNSINHESKKFFQIVGIKVKTNFYKKKIWYQPIILQKEKGILGILRRKKKKNYQYLIQAKVEPGNINKLQLSPTVQATKSNYNRVHKGKKVEYLNFFKKSNKKSFLINSQQSEQGGRYFLKYNNNLLVNIKNKIKLNKNYIWLDKKTLIKLVNKNNILNMDTLSVFSCAIKKNVCDLPVNSIGKISLWYKNLKKRYYIKTKIIPLFETKDWQFNKTKIFNRKKKYFSIIGLKIFSNSREVNKWEQPIIQEKNTGLSGFIIQKKQNTYHYLVSFSVKPGLKNPTMSCTARTSNVKNYLNDNNLSGTEKYFLKNYFLHSSGGKIRYNKTQSDEGGRFFKSQSKNVIIEIPEYKKIKITKNYIWMSHNQVLHFIKKGIFNIEARILFACFNLKKIL